MNLNLKLIIDIKYFNIEIISLQLRVKQIGKVLFRTQFKKIIRAIKQINLFRKKIFTLRKGWSFRRQEQLYKNFKCKLQQYLLKHANKETYQGYILETNILNRCYFYQLSK
ncbi:unnamed protein product [Paramecium sonneborni]|uniref:Uncharacterized protein n=1 Tax=Paramecium sonneborni TaxID=65129 RepID=A0A8S1LFY9_9CILI|nr:unnamed protein product [Paramecium sonneborni]